MTVEFCRYRIYWDPTILYLTQLVLLNFRSLLYSLCFLLHQHSRGREFGALGNKEFNESDLRILLSKAMMVWKVVQGIESTVGQRNGGRVTDNMTAGL